MRRKNKAGGALPNGWEFSKAYPMLADAVFIFEEFDFSGLVRAGVHSLRRQGLQVDCSNPHCHEGGYDLRPEIDLMLFRDLRRTKLICLQCEGWETKPTRSPTNVCTGCMEGTLELHIKKVVGQRNKKLMTQEIAAR